MRATPDSTALPVELQEQILSHLSTKDLYDLWHLWTSVRNVSTTFRSIVDGLVRKKHLKYTHIDYVLEDNDGNSKTCFDFHHISPENPNIAVFKADVDDEYREMMEDTLAEVGIKRQNTDQDIYRPRNLIYIRSYVNDCELQDYSIDFDAFELRCNWKGLFTAFCYEQQLQRNLKERDGYVGEPWNATEKAMDDSFKAWSKHHDNCKMKARRSRIARQCARQGKEFKEKSLEFRLFEKEALNQMKWAEHESDYVTFSD